jgi:D-sedoheptulose 7-phosphate isomerase
MDIDLKAQLRDSADAIAACSALLPTLEYAAEACIAALRSGGTIAFCGNGGSASQAQHFAAELVGRFRRERHAFSAIAFTTDSSILTAIGNDYGFDQVFSRQVDGLLRPGDVLIGLSTSGGAANVCLAAEAAHSAAVTVLGFTGRDGGRLAPLCDLELRVAAQETARIQECHLVLGHLLCDLIEAALSG